MLGSRRAYGPGRALDRARERGIGMTFDLRVLEEVAKEFEKRMEGGAVEGEGGLEARSKDTFLEPLERAPFPERTLRRTGCIIVRQVRRVDTKDGLSVLHLDFQILQRSPLSHPLPFANPDLLQPSGQRKAFTQTSNVQSVVDLVRFERLSLALSG